jgi:hypothetical protein
MRALFIALILVSAQIAFGQTITSRLAETQHIAAIIGLPPVGGMDGTDGADGDRAAARLGQTNRIVRSLLDADLAIASINNEISDLQQEQARLQSRSDARIKQLTIAAILLAGGGLVGELMEFRASFETLGSIIESVAEGAGIVIGALALREEDHGRTRRDVTFNMLAQVLDRPPLETSTYPDVVWKCLNSELPGSAGVTPRQQLLTDWSRNKLLGKKGRDEATIDSATSTHAGMTTRRRLSIGEIQDRVSMLTDTAAHIALFKRGLRDLIAETER